MRRPVQYESTQALTASASGVRPLPSATFTGAPRSRRSFTALGRAPGRHVKRGALLRDVEVAVAFVSRVDVHAEVEQVADAVGIAGTGELGKQRAHRLRGPREPARARTPRLRGRLAASLLAQAAIRRSTPRIRQRCLAVRTTRDVTPASSCGNRAADTPPWRLSNERVGAVVAAAARYSSARCPGARPDAGPCRCQRVMRLGSAPCSSGYLDAVVVVPVGFPEQHGRQAVGREPAAFDQHVRALVVVRFRRVIRHLVVVGIGAALEQQARQPGVVGDAGSAVQGALELGLRLVAISKKPEFALAPASSSAVAARRKPSDRDGSRRRNFEKQR